MEDESALRTIDRELNEIMKRVHGRKNLSKGTSENERVNLS